MSSDAISTDAPPRAGAIDEAATGRLTDWMARTAPGFTPPLEVRRFAGGQSNPTFLLVTPARRYVLRRKPPGEVLSSAHAVDREYGVMAALATAHFPVPAMYGLCTDETVIGSIFYVMEMVDGRILWDGRLPDFAPEQRRALYHAQIDTLADLHRIEPDAIGLGGFGRPGNYFERQVSRWTRQYRASQAPQNDAMERLIAWLPGTVPTDARMRVVHGDYRLDNMVIEPDAPSVKAVLDWELSTLGDPLADLTYLLMHWATPPHERNSLTGLDLAALGIPTTAEMIDRYQARTGLTLLRPIEWYFAYNLFRLAAILQGVAGRAQAGQANNERALQAQGRVAPLAATAWDFARQAGAPA
jgi:aminoglycoside phosphotransferase (APT) family kinase protein